MPVLSFLEGEGREGAGWLIGEILALNDHELERRHDFIQWLFALPEPSRAQAQSPTLTPAEITAIGKARRHRKISKKAVELISGF
jgi:Opioid growth factor receptor (OGFr) conserved region